MHAEAWALCSEYRDQPEWSLFLKDCAILDSYSLPSPVNSDIHMSCPPSKRLHFEDYLIKVCFMLFLL